MVMLPTASCLTDFLAPSLRRRRFIRSQASMPSSPSKFPTMRSSGESRAGTPANPAVVCFMTLICHCRHQGALAAVSSRSAGPTIPKIRFGLDWPPITHKRGPLPSITSVLACFIESTAWATSSASPAPSSPLLESSEHGSWPPPGPEWPSEASSHCIHHDA